MNLTCYWIYHGLPVFSLLLSQWFNGSDHGQVVLVQAYALHSGRIDVCFRFASPLNKLMTGAWGCGMGCSQLGDSFGHQKWAFEHQQNRFSHWIVTQNRFVQVAVFMGKLMMFLVGFMCWIAKWRRTGGLKSIDGIDSSSVAYPIFPRAISVANWVLAKVVDPVVTWNASFPGRVQERV